MIECEVEVQYVRSDDLDQRGQGPYQCVHRGELVQRDGMADMDKAVHDIERDHLRAMDATQPLVHMYYHLEPVDRLPA